MKEEIGSNNLIPDVPELLVSEVVKVLIIPTADTNNQGNQSLLLVLSMTVEDEKNIRMIKAAVQSKSGSFNTRLFVVILGGDNSIKMIGLRDIFQA